MEHQPISVHIGLEIIDQDQNRGWDKPTQLSGTEQRKQNSDNWATFEWQSEKEPWFEGKQKWIHNSNTKAQRYQTKTKLANREAKNHGELFFSILHKSV